MLIKTNDDADYEIDIDNKFEFFEGGDLLLTDADPIAYSAAAACDSVEHIIKYNGVTLFSVQGGKQELYGLLGFTDYRDFGAMLENNPDVVYEEIISSDDGANMKHTIKAQIKRLIKNTEAGSIKLFLTDGATNFRLTEEIHTILKYKGNRSPNDKPQMLAEARAYLMEELDAIMCIGLEADDQLAIEHMADWTQAMDEAAMTLSMDDTDEKFEGYTLEDQEKLAMTYTRTILATIDKDIKMIPGKFINPDQDLGVEEIFPMGHLIMEIKKKSGGKPPSKKLRFSGLRGFYAQILLGDDCDNIPGVYFCGDVAVHKLLEGCESEEQLFKAVFREIHEGFHRQRVAGMDEELMSRVDQAIISGLHGNDNKSNRAKLKSKFKKMFIKQMAYEDKKYYHWSEYKLKDDGTVSNVLEDPENANLISISALDYLLEVARLLNMLTVPVNEAGDHLWTPPNMDWVKSVQDDILNENLLRIPTGG